MKKLSLLVLFTVLVAVLLSVTATVALAETPDYSIVIVNDRGETVTATEKTELVNGVESKVFEVVYGESYSARIVSSAVTVKNQTLYSDDTGVFTPTVQNYTDVKHPDGNNDIVSEYRFYISFTYGDNGAAATPTFYLRILKAKKDVSYNYGDATESVPYRSTTPLKATFDDKVNVALMNIEMRYRYYADNAAYLSGTPLASYPTTIGDYVVEAYADNANYEVNAESGVKPFTISQSAATITAKNATLEHNGTGYALVTALEANAQGDNYDGQEKLIALVGDSRTPMSNIDEVGTYDVYFRFENTAAFSSPEAGPYEFTLNLATVSLITKPVTVPFSAMTLKYGDGAADDFYAVNGNGVAIVGLTVDTDYSISYYDANKQLIDYSLDTLPGSYFYKISVRENSYRNSAESDFTQLTITKQMRQIGVGNTTLDYTGADLTISAEQSANVVLTVPSELSSATPIFTYLKKQGEDYVAFSSVPKEPGEYKVSVTYENAFYTASKEFVVTVNKVDLSSFITFDDSGYTKGNDNYYSRVYNGTAATPVPAVTVPTGKPQSGTVISNFVLSQYNRVIGSSAQPLSVAPSAVGQYSVTVSINNPFFSGAVTLFYRINKADLTLKPKDLTVAYGAKPYGADSRDYTDKVLSVRGLAEGDNLNSLLSHLTITIDNVKNVFDATVEVGTHTLTIGGTTDNYTILSEEGTLTVEKATLNIIPNAYNQSETATFSPSNITYTYTGAAYDSTEFASAVKAAVEIYFVGANEVEYTLSQPPTAVGSYSIMARGNMENYTINPIHATFSIYSGKFVSTTAGVTASGKFTADSSLEFAVVSANSAVENAVSASFKKYVAAKVISVSGNAATFDNSVIKIDIDVSDIDDDDFKVLAKIDGSYVEVDWIMDGDKIEIAGDKVASCYVICTKKPINWSLIILIGSIVAGVILAVVVVIRIYRTGFLNFSKGKAAEVVKPSENARTEDDEFDDMIANFDASTVADEKSYAEKLEEKRQKEIYEQYKLKLQRARRAGDKAVEDKLRSEGVSKVDDDAIIRQMIADDEQRARQLEEDAEKEKQAKEAAEKAVNTVIVKKGGDGSNYEQKTFAPKAKKDDGDIDF